MVRNSKCTDESRRHFFFNRINTTGSLNQINKAYPIANKSVKDINVSDFFAPLACLGAACLLMPNSSTGFSAGMVTFAISLTIVCLEEVIAPLPPAKTNEYASALRKNMMLGTVHAPIIEEFIFRGAMLLLMEALKLPSYAETTEFILHPVTMIILLTSLVFGATHLPNKHNAAYRQAVYATLIGIAYGTLAVQFGLEASIVAHMTHNTMLHLFVFISSNGVSIKSDNGINEVPQNEETGGKSFDR